MAIQWELLFPLLIKWHPPCWSKSVKRKGGCQVENDTLCEIVCGRVIFDLEVTLQNGVEKFNGIQAFFGSLCK